MLPILLHVIVYTTIINAIFHSVIFITKNTPETICNALNENLMHSYVLLTQQQNYDYE